jgi:hypothetical protein
MKNPIDNTAPSKQWVQSKTILFNVLIAVLTVLTAESDTLRGLLSDRGYVYLMLFVAVGNALLHLKTSAAIAKPRFIRKQIKG